MDGPYCSCKLTRVRSRRREREYTMMEQREEQKLDRMDKLFHLERSRRIMEYRKDLAW